MWNDLYTYWKYLVGLFVYTILLVLPIYLNINTLASSITGTTNQLLHMAYLYYVLNTLWNGYFLFRGVHFYYLVLYLVLILLYGIFNPYHLITTVVPMITVFFLTLVLMILLILFKIDILTTLFVFLLTISSQMCLYSFSYKPTFLVLGVIALYLIGYKLFFVPLTRPTINTNYFIAIIAFFQALGQSIYNMNTLEKNGLFLLFTGIFLYLYIRSISKNYYGGQLLINEPISLEQVNTFPIEPNYHSSLSCWFYLTPSKKTEYNTIMLYGDQLLVSYEGYINSLRIRLKNNISYIERKVLLQKWNHLAIVYENGKIILFLNGEVIHSSEWSPPSFTDELLIGKVQGKICNLRFYKDALSERFVQSLYGDFKNKNPPIN